MPGPFPGMDPYLEDHTFWPGVHDRFIPYASDLLNELLPPGYAADIGERVYVERSRREVIPDVVVAHHLSLPRAARGPSQTAVLSDPPFVVEVEPSIQREIFIQVLALREDERVVTTIELLSPANKAAGSSGRELYRKKQDELLESACHLVEIDLLRTGAYTVAAPPVRSDEFGSWDYLVCLHRAGGWRYELWPFPLLQRLPRILIPLLENDEDIVLDLQAVLDQLYDRGRYSTRIDYQKEPAVPLSVDAAGQVDAWLQGKGLRQ